MGRLKLSKRLRWSVVIFLTITAYLYLTKSSKNSSFELDNINHDEEKIKIQQPAFRVAPQPSIEEINKNNNRHIEVELNGQKVRKIDWHDYKKIAEEAQRHGPGEQGVGVVLDSREEKQKNNLLRENGFNAFLSDKISLERSINDIRHPECKKKLYLERLPNVSIIIPFHNEHFSVLLRSVYSIINRTPKELLEEIILVDDFSTKSFLKDNLDNYVKTNFAPNLVKIIRLNKREGLIRTRLAGAQKARGEVLIFFDSHIECNVNWLPPLIEPIAYNYKTAVCPFIDVISDETFAYSAQDNGARGAFDWDLFYKRLPLLDTSKPTEPFDDPVMAGGLFAISAKWFWELEGYDEGLEIWGGEQYELSFKIWQCGGRLVDAPCSRVGHIYRKFNPFGSAGHGDYLSKNHKRVAEVWMDEYKKYYYKENAYLKNLDAGDLTKQKALKEKLQCKSFKWFMENIAFDLVNYYPPIPPSPYASGEIRSQANPSLCIDTQHKTSGSSFGLKECLKDNHGHMNGEQIFELTWHRDIRPKGSDRCFDASQSLPSAPIILFQCHGMHGNQEFFYNIDTLAIYHPISNQCLDSSIERKELFMNPCSNDKKTQQWKFEHYNETMIKKDFKFKN